MADSESELLVSIRADTEDLNSKLEGATASVEESTSQWEASFERVAERLAEYFAIEKVVEFVKGSVEKFAEVGRAFDILGAQVTRNGGNWQAAKANVDEFVKSEEILTGASQEDLLKTLNAAEAKTRDLGAAMKITDDAARLQAVGVGSLARNVKVLALAYDGSQMGIQGLGRLLGMNDTEAKDSTKVFALLSKTIGSVGSVADDTAGQLKKMEVIWEDTQIRVGEELSTLIPLIAGLEKTVASFIENLFLIGKTIVDVALMPLKELILSFQAVSREIGAVDDALHGRFKLSLEETGHAIKDYYKGVKASVSDMFGQMGQDIDESSTREKDIWLGTHKAEIESDQEFQAQVHANSLKADADAEAAAAKRRHQHQKDYSMMVADAETSIKKIKDLWAEDQENPVAEAKATAAANQFATQHPLEAARKALLDAEQNWKDSYAEAKQFEQKANAAWAAVVMHPGEANLHAAHEAQKAWTDAEKAVQQSDTQYQDAWQTLQDQKLQVAQKNADARYKMEADLGDALIHLGESGNRQMMEIAKQAAAARAIINTAVGVSQAFADYPYPFSIGIAAAVAIEGGLEVAKIESQSFKEGGIVTSPTLSTIGDGNEPEMALPLSKAKEMGFGGGGGTENHTHHYHFPGVTNATEAHKAGHSAALSFIKTQQASKTRAGYRNTGF